MTELQHIDTTPELYERLINRLGLALEIAKTSVRLRDELPQELELRGLSRAEFEIIEAYLEKDVAAPAAVLTGELKGSFMVSREPAGPVSTPQRSAKVIWLKDQKRAKASAKLSRYSSRNFIKR
ncbi:hypothetical protein [Pseudomonas sp. DWP3-1-2]|jgi:hypothetical protein|uniref:hypothetical protein n=1 Tax=Pseudomonas sp. DWP3-1-2 TaxID=2804645 RepID=UPI003CEB30E1